MAGRSVPDGILGALGVAMILVAFWLFLFGGPSDASSDAGSPPPIQLLAPSHGDTVLAPLELRFSSPVPLAIQPGGWGAGGFHLHAEVDNRERMPGPMDIQRRTDGTYAWVVPNLSKGEHQLSLVWSDTEHRPVSGGGTKRVSVAVR